jgi:4-hydroxybutyrate dehydrogenase/sulfolactaldehyde 3-reductase
MDMEQIGFIGLGRMGLPMATNLIKQGYQLHCFDIIEEQLNMAVQNGGQRCNSVAEVVDASDVIITMLPNSEIVKQVITAEQTSILAASKAGQLIMDMSTVSPETTDYVAESCTHRGVEFVDAPVGRLASHADNGESLFMVGATEAGFARVLPLLNIMGSDIFHCGGYGAGTRTKLVNNFLAISYCQMNAEALSLAERFGLNLDSTLDVLFGTTAVNGQMKIAWPAKVLSDDTAPGFTIDLAHKDLSLVVNAANTQQVAMPMAAAAREAFSLARSRGFGSKDFSAMLDVQCELSGLTPPRFQPASRYKP